MTSTLAQTFSVMGSIGSLHTYFQQFHDGDIAGGASDHDPDGDAREGLGQIQQGGRRGQHGAGPGTDGSRSMETCSGPLLFSTLIGTGFQLAVVVVLLVILTERGSLLSTPIIM